MKIQHSISVACPACKERISYPETVQIEGHMIWGKLQCKACSKEFEQAFPFSHAQRFPIIRIAENSSYSYPKASPVEWLLAPLREETKVDLPISIDKRKSLSRVRIFNCLDACYGHAVLKLWQVSPWLHQQEVDVVVLAPECLRWMLPAQLAAIVLVSGPLSTLKYPINKLNEKVSEVLSEATEIQIDQLPLSFDYHTINLTDFIGNFGAEKSSQFSLVINWRDDRLWTRGIGENFLHKIFLKYKISWVQNFLIWRQTNRIQTLLNLLKSNYPSLEVTIIGISHTAKKVSWGNDLRSIKPTEEDERSWAAALAKSDLVIGVHGSHMILASALSKGIINLVPDWKVMHWGEDMIGLGSELEWRTRVRTLPTSVSANKVAEHAHSILGWWKQWYS